jgi:hypothetical protein
MNQKWLPLANAIVLAGAGLVLSAGLYIGLYNDLSIDDLWRSAWNGRTYWEKIVGWYNHENGRYTNAILVLYPEIYRLGVYRLLHIVTMAAWIACLWVFFASYLKTLNIDRARAVTALLTGSIVLVMTANAPNLGEWWFAYWGASYYMLGSALLLLSYAYILKAVQSRGTGYWYVAGVVMFLAVGSLELTMFIGTMTTAMIAAVLVIRYRQTISLVPFGFALAGSIIQLVAPGLTRRLGSATGSGSILDQVTAQLAQIYHQLIPTLWAGAGFWTRDSLWLYLAVVCFLGGIGARNTSRETSRGGTMLFVAALSISILVLLGVVIVALEFKINMNDESRASNFMNYMFLLALGLNSFNLGLLAGKFLKGIPAFTTIQGVALAVSTSLLVAIALTRENVEIMVEDIRLDKPARQSESIAHWDQLIQQAKSDGKAEVTVPNMVPALSLAVYRYGPKMDPGYWLNKHWKKYKGLDNQVFTKRHFDRALLQSVHDRFEPIEDGYNLQTYQDQYRNYVIAQVPEWTTNTAQFCVELQPQSGESYSLRLRDENHARLFYQWDNNRFCADFVSRRLYCEPHRQSWFCRIGLPLDFSGQLETSWGENTRKISIN